jgi:DNA-binding transcriptional LysR family regulator
MAGPSGEYEDVKVAPRVSGNTAQSLRRATVAGLGIALLPNRIARLDLQAGRLVPVLPQYHCPGYGLNVLYPSRRHLPHAVSAFIDVVVEKLSEEGRPHAPIAAEALGRPNIPAKPRKSRKRSRPRSERDGR